MNSRHMLAFVVLSILACAGCVGCSGALNGGTWNVGHEDNRVAGAKLYDQHCGGCHDPKAGTDAWHAKMKIAPVLPNVPGSDLLSSAWRTSILTADDRAGQHPPDGTSLAEWLAAEMAVKFQHACAYGVRRWPNGDPLDYNSSTTPRAGQRVVLVMPPCELAPPDFRAIVNWITCHQYPGTSACKRQQ